MYTGTNVIEALIAGIVLGSIAAMGYYHKLSPMVKRLKKEAYNIRGKF